MRSLPALVKFVIFKISRIDRQVKVMTQSLSQLSKKLTKRIAIAIKKVFLSTESTEG